jgi:hypothetical protein
MLDQEAWTIADERIRAEFARRGPLVTNELVKVQSDAVKAGALHSSGMAAAILDICAKEVEILTDEAWKIVQVSFKEQRNPLRTKTWRTLAVGSIDCSPLTATTNS